MSKKKRSPDEGTSDEESEEEPGTSEEPKNPSQGGNGNGSPGNEHKRIQAEGTSRGKKIVIGAAVGAAVLVVGAPLCIPGLGFTRTGIAAGSIAVQMLGAAVGAFWSSKKGPDEKSKKG